MAASNPGTYRRNYKNSHAYSLDGAKADGVTSILGKGMPKPAIITWTGRTVAEFCMNNLPALGALTFEEGVELAKGAPNRDRDKAARRGTEVHGLAQRLQAGEEIDVPDELEGHVDAYIDFCRDWKPVDVLTELTVVNRKHGYMGTLDFLGTIPGLGLCLLDIKTTRSGIFGETALQIAAYRYAESYLSGVEETPMPAVDFTGAIWLRADGYDFVPVVADERTFRSFLYCQQVAKLMDRLPGLVLPALQPNKEDARVD